MQIGPATWEGRRGRVSIVHRRALRSRLGALAQQPSSGDEGAGQTKHSVAGVGHTGVISAFTAPFSAAAAVSNDDTWDPPVHEG